MIHLSKSKTCQEYYDMEGLRNEKKKRSLEQHKERVKRYRGNKTPDEKDEDKDKAKERMRNLRANRTPDEKDEEKEKAKERMTNLRANKTTIEKDEVFYCSNRD